MPGDHAARAELIRAGQVLLADKGFTGREFKAFTEAIGLRLLRPDRKDETYRNGSLGQIRQWIESVNQTLKAQLSLEDHGGRTPTGVFTRVAQRLAALAAGIWHNGTTDTPTNRSVPRMFTATLPQTTRSTGRTNSRVHERSAALVPLQVSLTLAPGREPGVATTE